MRILAAHKGLGFFTAFTEEKRMTVLRKPLTSSGHLLFIPTRGLYRHLQKPFVQEMFITSEAIHQRQGNDRTTALPLDTLPEAKAFVGAFLASFPAPGTRSSRISKYTSPRTHRSGTWASSRRTKR